MVQYSEFRIVCNSASNANHIFQVNRITIIMAMTVNPEVCVSAFHLNISVEA